MAILPPSCICALKGALYQGPGIWRAGPLLWFSFYTFNQTIMKAYANRLVLQYALYNATKFEIVDVQQKYEVRCDNVHRPSPPQS